MANLIDNTHCGICAVIDGIDVDMPATMFTAAQWAEIGAFAAAYHFESDGVALDFEPGRMMFTVSCGAQRGRIVLDSASCAYLAAMADHCARKLL